MDSLAPSAEPPVPDQTLDLVEVLWAYVEACHERASITEMIKLEESPNPEAVRAGKKLKVLKGLTFCRFFNSIEPPSARAGTKAYISSESSGPSFFKASSNK